MLSTSKLGQGFVCAFLFLSVTLLLEAAPMPVHASGLVQEGSLYPSPSSCPLIQPYGLPCKRPIKAGAYGSPVSGIPLLPHDVVAGDALIVGIIGACFPSCVSASFPVGITSLKDALHTPLTEIVSATGSTMLGHSIPPVSILVGTLTSSGPDNLIFSWFTKVDLTATTHVAPVDFYMFEISGVTTAGATTGQGSGTGTSIGTSPTLFQSGAFLLGMLGLDCPYSASSCLVVTPGAGFQPVAAQDPDLGGFYGGQVSDPVSSPTIFSATLSGSENWVEVGLALPPLVIPEYPLGLVILGIMMIITYGVIKRRTG
jgi:hypothetical protein